VIATPSTGQQIDLGTVVLQALDVNTNNIPDYRKYRVHSFDPTGTLGPKTGWNSPPPSATTMDWTNMSPSADDEIYTIEVRFP
jgi:hypothetical protein